jgi:hypothetical protein
MTHLRFQHFLALTNSTHIYIGSQRKLESSIHNAMLLFCCFCLFFFRLVLFLLPFFVSLCLFICFVFVCLCLWYFFFLFSFFYLLLSICFIIVVVFSIFHLPSHCLFPTKEIDMGFLNVLIVCCLFVYLFIYLFISFIYLLILFLDLLIYLFIDWFIYLFIHLFILFIYLIYLFVYLFVILLIYLFHLFISLLQIFRQNQSNWTSTHNRFQIMKRRFKIIGIFLNWLWWPARK